MLHAQGVDVVFYGDSITETWRGTDMGRGCRRCAGVPAVFQHYFGKYSTSVLAVGGARLSPPKSVVSLMVCSLACMPRATAVAIFGAEFGSYEKAKSHLLLLHGTLLDAGGLLQVST